MTIIQDSDIRGLGLQPADFIDMVRHCFVHKPECQLPPKISLHPKGDDFINTMPCLLPPGEGRFCVKVVSRAEGRTPSLRSDAMLFDTATGELLAVVDTDYITAMRTGAVAALAVATLRSSQAHTVALMGLGNTGRATMACLAALPDNLCSDVRLLRYKDQAEQFAEHFAHLKNVHFSIVDSVADLFDGADIIVSCITSADGLFAPDASVFKPGVLVVPVHTRGFQNCDTVFDRVVCDDVGHVRGFRYFDQFPNLTELGDIVRGDKPGRHSDSDRIIDYNIGLGLHDAYICSRVYDTVCGRQHSDAPLLHAQGKFIV